MVKGHQLKACRRCGKIKAIVVDLGPEDRCDVCGFKMVPIDLYYNEYGAMSEIERERYITALTDQPDSPEWIIKRRKYDIEHYSVSEEYKRRKKEYTPKCPICGSPDIKKISMFSKGMMAGLFGIFSLPYQGKQWHCNSCDTDF